MKKVFREYPPNLYLFVSAIKEKLLQIYIILQRILKTSETEQGLQKHCEEKNCASASRLASDERLK